MRMSFIRNSLISATAVVTLAGGAAVARAESVAKGERDLLVVAELTTHADQSYAWLYRFLEANAVSMAERKLSGSYRAIYALAKENATLDNFHRGLAGMSREPAVKAIDVFVNLHGGPSTLWLHEGGYASADIGTAIAAHDGVQSKLRLLYSSACYGVTHNADFLNAGFKVVSGARKVNTNGAHDYGAVMDAWRAGYTFDEAQASGNNQFWIDFWDGVAAANGFEDTDSFKVVDGRKDLRIGEL